MAHNNIKVYFQNLISIAFADGHLSDRELSFLKHQAAVHDIPEDDLMSWIESASNLHFVKPPHILVRHAYLDHYIDMILADDVIHPKELEMCKRICGIIGLTDEDLYAVIEARNLSIIT